MVSANPFLSLPLYKGLRLALCFGFVSVFFSQCFWGNQCLEPMDCPLPLRCQRGLCLSPSSETSRESSLVEPGMEGVEGEELVSSLERSAEASSETSNPETQREPVAANDTVVAESVDEPLVDAREPGDVDSGVSKEAGEPMVESGRTDENPDASPESKPEFVPDPQPLVCDAAVSEPSLSCQGWAVRHDTNLDVGGGELHRMALDSQGNIYMVGALVGSRTYGATTLQSKGGKDILVVKLSPSGQYLWARHYGGSLDEVAYGITVDSKDSIYIAGSFKTTLTLGTTTLSGAGVEAFVAKLDASGSPQWAISAGGAQRDLAVRLANDASGSLYVLGLFSSTATFGTSQLTSSGDADLFVAKVSPTGIFQWVTAGGGAAEEIVGGIAVDAKQNVYIAGAYTKAGTFGSFLLSHGNLTNILVAKLSPAGTFLWAKGAGKNNFEQCNDVATDPSGNVYVTGFFRSSTVTMGTFSFATFGDSDGFVAKLDPQGQWLWAKQMGGSTFDQGKSIAASSTHVYITGFFQDVSTFGSTTLTSPGSYSIFVSKMDHNGNFLGARSVGGANNRDESQHIRFEPSGFLYVNGTFSGTVTFPPTTLQSQGLYDGFLWKLNATFAP